MNETEKTTDNKSWFDIVLAVQDTKWQNLRLILEDVDDRVLDGAVVHLAGVELVADVRVLVSGP